jgi:hypothetical protein
VSVRGPPDESRPLSWGKNPFQSATWNARRAKYLDFGLYVRQSSIHLYWPNNVFYTPIRCTTPPMTCVWHTLSRTYTFATSFIAFYFLRSCTHLPRIVTAVVVIGSMVLVELVEEKCSSVLFYFIIPSISSLFAHRVLLLTV